MSKRRLQIAWDWMLPRIGIAIDPLTYFATSTLLVRLVLLWYDKRF